MNDPLHSLLTPHFGSVTTNPMFGTQTASGPRMKSGICPLHIAFSGLGLPKCQHVIQVNLQDLNDPEVKSVEILKENTSPLSTCLS